MFTLALITLCFFFASILIGATSNGKTEGAVIGVIYIILSLALVIATLFTH